MARPSEVLAAIFLLLTSSCRPWGDDDRPRYRDVRRIELMLNGNKCIGSLDRWARKFAFGWKDYHRAIDHEVIHFEFRQAGLFGYEAGRTIEEPDNTFSVDDRQFEYAGGTYDLTTHELDLESCGPNLSQE